MSKALWKTTVVIWTAYDPSDMEIDVLAREAMGGSAYCARQDSEPVTDPDGDPDWDGTEFFGTDTDLGTGLGTGLGT